MEKLSNFNKNLLKIGSKLDAKKYQLTNNSGFLNQNKRAYKGGQSRNITSGLMNAKSVGANADNFSFIRPTSIKGDNNFEKLGRKQHKTKKSKGGKHKYEDMSTKMFKSYHENSRVTKTAGDDSRPKMLVSTNNTKSR
jgi:hypothetical protein